MDTFTLLGRILGPDGQGIKGLKIEAWDKDGILKDDFLGSATSGILGEFKIQFKRSDFQDLVIFDRKPDIYFRIYEGDALLHSTEEEVMWQWKESGQELIIRVDPSTVPIEGFAGNFGRLDASQKMKVAQGVISAASFFKGAGVQNVKDALLSFRNAPGLFHPHETLGASLEALAKGEGEKALFHTGWRFLFQTADEKVHALDLHHNPEKDNYEHPQLEFAEYNQEIHSLMDTLSEEEKSDFAFIRIPAAFLMALWLRGTQQIIPIADTFHSLPNGQKMPAVDFFNLLALIAKSIGTAPQESE